MSKGARLTVLLMLLAFVGQAVASTFFQCPQEKSIYAADMEMDSMDHSIHAMGQDSVHKQAPEKEASNDCCKQGLGQTCSVICCAIAVPLAETRYDLLTIPLREVELLITAKYESQAQSSLFRPPIFS